MRNRVQGFTMVELLVVLAILAILAAMLIPAVSQVIESAHRATCAAQLKGLSNAYQAYAAEIGYFPPLYSWEEFDEVQREYVNLRVNDNARIYASGSEYGWTPGFGPLFFHQRVTNADDFICPEVRKTNEPWWHSSPEPSYMWFHGDEVNAHPDVIMSAYADSGGNPGGYDSFASYCIRPGLFPHTLEALEREGIRAIMADNFNSPEAVEVRHSDGVNVAYLDGTVRYWASPLLWDPDEALMKNASMGETVSGDLEDVADTEQGKVWEMFDH